VTALLLAALYPPPAAFSHTAHAAVECKRCHPTVAQALRPGGGAADPKACATCHDDGRISVTPRGAPAPLRFGHRPHLARGANCDDCHAGANRPSETDCRICHDGSRANARCATCHPIRPDGRLRTALPTGPLIPGDHRRPAFAKGHGAQAAADPESCRACHAERACNACHDGVVRPLEVHPADYLATHAPPARRNDPDCTRCHRLQTFCVGCHRQAGVTDHAGPLEFRGSDFHPSGWVDYLGGPSDHGIEARRNLRACVGCHEERTCVRCHSTETTATLRADPHPPGFARRCGVNRRGCAKCHSDPAALERLCGR